jgi:hypothetical protein
MYRLPVTSLTEVSRVAWMPVGTVLGSRLLIGSGTPAGRRIVALAGASAFCGGGSGG